VYKGKGNATDNLNTCSQVRRIDEHVYIYIYIFREREREREGGGAFVVKWSPSHLVPGYRSRVLGFDSWRYHIFLEVVELERSPLSLVRIIEDYMNGKVADPV
jgi:hypothetical protein